MAPDHTNVWTVLDGRKPKSSMAKRSRSKDFLVRIGENFPGCAVYSAHGLHRHDNVKVVQDVCGFRWSVERFHRETKQLTGIEGCQCRKARIVRNHIGCAIMTWVRLNQVAPMSQRTICQIKNGLLSDYLRQQLKSPAILTTLA